MAVSRCSVVAAALVCALATVSEARADAPAFPNAIAEAQTMVNTVERDARELRLELRSARSHQDALRAKEMSDRVSQVDVTARRARVLRDQVAVAKNGTDGKAVWRALLELSALRDHANRIWREVEQEDAGGRSIEGSSVVVVIDPKIPKGD
jgi:hypothetical protein